jgi:hypothetical protein
MVPRPTRIALPEVEYLLKIGQLAYMASSLEWLILGDLPVLSAALPAELTLPDLADKTMGAMAKSLIQGAQRIADRDVQAYVRAAGEALEATSRHRNDMLHARPATVDGNQRLHRWHRGGAVAFTIDDPWLDSQIAELDRRDTQVHELRAAAHRAAGVASA